MPQKTDWPLQSGCLKTLSKSHGAGKSDIKRRLAGLTFDPGKNSFFGVYIRHVIWFERVKARHRRLVKPDGPFPDAAQDIRVFGMHRLSLTGL